MIILNWKEKDFKNKKSLFKEIYNYEYCCGKINQLKLTGQGELRKDKFMYLNKEYFENDYEGQILWEWILSKTESLKRVSQKAI